TFISNDLKFNQLKKGIERWVPFENVEQLNRPDIQEFDFKIEDKVLELKDGNLSLVDLGSTVLVLSIDHNNMNTQLRKILDYLHLKFELVSNTIDIEQQENKKVHTNKSQEMIISI